MQKRILQRLGLPSSKRKQLWLSLFSLTLVLLTLMSATPAAAATAMPSKKQAALSFQRPTPGQSYCAPKTSPPHCEVISLHTATIGRTDVYFGEEWLARHEMAYPIPRSFGPKGLHHHLTNIPDFGTFCTNFQKLCDDMQVQETDRLTRANDDLRVCVRNHPSNALQVDAISSNTKVVLVFLFNATVYAVLNAVVPTVFTFNLTTPYKIGIPTAVGTIGAILLNRLGPWEQRAIQQNENRDFFIVVGGLVTSLLKWLGRAANEVGLRFYNCGQSFSQELAGLCPWPSPLGGLAALARRVCYPDEPRATDV